MTRIRIDLTIEKKNIILLDKIISEEKKKGRTQTRSGIINKLIEQKLVNPIERLREENRELAQRINTNQEAIKHFERIKEANQC